MSKAVTNLVTGKATGSSDWLALFYRYMSLAHRDREHMSQPNL